MKFLLALVVLLAGLHDHHVALAQVSTYSMIVNCPQGCREIDKTTSCGSSAKTKACIMHDNGDVMINCTNGKYYTLGRFGCGGDPAPGQTPESILPKGFSEYIEQHEAEAQVRTTALFDAIPSTVLAGILFTLAALHGLIGFATIRFITTIPSLLLGLVFGYIVVAFFVPQDTVLQQWVSLTAGCVLGILLLLLTCLKRGATKVILGASLGLMLALLYLYIYQNKLKDDYFTMGVDLPFFIILSSMVFFTSLAGCIPFISGVFLFSVESATFVAWGYTLLTHESSSSKDPLSDPSVTGGLFGGVFAGVALMQSFWAHRMIQKARKEKIRQEMLEQQGGPLDPANDPLHLAQEREREKKRKRKEEKKRRREEQRGGGGRGGDASNSGSDSDGPTSGLLQDGPHSSGRYGATDQV